MFVQTVYHLTGVICHHGMAGGGHYTSYCLNYIDNCWYEFDDSFVRPVEPSTVANAEAYVLFYRKNSGGKGAIIKRPSSGPVILFHCDQEWRACEAK